MDIKSNSVLEEKKNEVNNIIVNGDEEEVKSTIIKDTNGNIVGVLDYDLIGLTLKWQQEKEEEKEERKERE